MSAELATIEGEVIEEAPRAPLNLFGTDDPVDVVARATVMADALADVIRSKGLSTHIGNRDHIQVGGWTLLGSMLGVFAEVVWSRPIEGGWEARAVARTLSGAIVGASEAMCTRKERTWAGRDEYALRSMAQTRAVSKALRLPLGFIVELAGYSATPLEEVDDAIDSERRAGGGERPSGQVPSSPNRASAPAPRTKGEAMDRYAQALHGANMNFAQGNALWKRHGLDRASASIEDIMRIVAEIEQPSSGVPTAPADGGAGDARASAPSTDTPTPDRSGSGPATVQDREDAAVSPGTPSGPALAQTFSDPSTLLTFAAAVVNRETADLKDLSPLEWDGTWAALNVLELDAYQPWFTAQDRAVRVALTAVGQSFAQRRDRAKEAAKRPDAEPLRAQIGGGA